MALLQISEPGQAPDPHQRRIAVGIDLGTTHSLVASVRNGVAECLPDEKGQVILPSVVRYLPGQGRQIGHDAVANAAQDPENTLASVKRFMGRSLSDIAHPEKLPYKFVKPEDNAAKGMLSIQTVQGEKSPVEVSAEILATLRYRAEDTFNDDLYGAVITVPAYFDEAQRQATKDAAQMAGINVLRLINEPTAAAIAYGLDNASEGIYAVFDLGGGTFDISVLRLTRGVFEVMATGGDSALGGDDYDHALADAALASMGLSDVQGTLSAEDKTRLKAASRSAKEALTSASEVALTWTHADQSHEVKVTRSQFEEAAAALTARCMSAVKKALRDAKVKTEDIQGVVMVGGSTRMPQVQEAVANFFGKPPLNNLNPDEVVALGAAIQANQLAATTPLAICCFLMLFLCPWALKPWAAWWSASFRAIKPFPRPWPKTSPLTKMVKPHWPCMCCRVSAIWWLIAAAWLDLNCVAFPLWPQVLRAFASPSRWTPMVC